MREDARTKGLRLLVDGRLFVREVNPATGYIYAECRGDSGEMYKLGFNPRTREWKCKCVARGKCSHLWALQTVTALPEGIDVQSAIAGNQRNVVPPVLAR